MSVTPGGITFEEIERSPIITLSPRGMMAQRIFKVDWADWEAFVRELIGNYQVVGGSATVIQPLPFPSQPNLVTDDLIIEPFMSDSPDGQVGVTLDGVLNTYAGGARITAIYRTLWDSLSKSRSDLPNVPAGTFLTYEGDLGAEFLTVPGRNFEWVGTAPAEALPDDAAPGILIPTNTFSLTWHRVLLPPWTQIRDLRGQVNNAVFLGAPAGTVLFLGAASERQFQFNDSGFWRMRYFFSENTKELSTGAKVGWNHFYKENPVAGEHWVQVRDLSGNLPYKSGSFTPLFGYGTV